MVSHHVLMPLPKPHPVDPFHFGFTAVGVYSELDSLSKPIWRLKTTTFRGLGWHTQLVYQNVKKSPDTGPLFCTVFYHMIHYQLLGVSTKPSKLRFNRNIWKVLVKKHQKRFVEREEAVTRNGK